jgi:hypothetical protein
MKKTIILNFLLLTTICSFAQKWQQTIGQATKNEYSNRITEHYDKGYIITGGYDDQIGWVIKTDINGNVLWDKILGVDPDQVLIDKTIFDEVGNMYVFGTMKEDYLEDAWPFVIKLNACGEKQWCRLLNFSGYNYGFFTDAIFLENGDLLGLASLPNEDQHDMVYLICMSQDGEFKWKQSYASKDNYPDFAMRLGSRLKKFNNLYIISGYVYSPDPGGNPNNVYLRPMFIGIDTMFNEQWVLEFGINESVLGISYNCISLNDTVYMGVGTHRFIENNELINNSLLMFFDKSGDELGYNTILNEAIGSNIKSNFIFDIARINDTVFITTSAFGESYEGNPWGELVIDTSGFIYQQMSRNNTVGSSYIAKTYDNKYIIAAILLNSNSNLDIYLYKVNQNLEHDTIYPGNYNYDSLCPNLPIQSGVINLLGCDLLTGIDEIPSLEEFNKQKNQITISAFPNPAIDGSITLGFTNTKSFSDMELKCFDVFGKQVHSEKVYQNQGECKLNVSDWNKGVYVAIIYSNGITLGWCKFVVN